MNTIEAVYSNGVFRPTDPVALPDNCHVELTVRCMATCSPDLTDAEYQQRLVQAGLVQRAKTRLRDQTSFERFQPVTISGQPLSETIIEERR